ncbi:iron-containing redox enzyme family protein [Paeniglutamicibacter cryotolerans]|uniref:Iron-containing redox enzyme family protein n=1 Tax=Paeniglutamicibacter cryotolerans TaxID=670079 RepID=A0A839QWB9_9MICC|nr:iron-containing redox enzyme family protein [Paeniglutamicibacter cryotolerans]MBB2997602.1 hypothetical protein [Paeniglutamicibacter cryotolerans]
MKDLPAARGPLSEVLRESLLRNDLPLAMEALEEQAAAALLGTADILFDEDLQISLFILYELHYSGFSSLIDWWEWHPPLLGLRARLEEALENRLYGGIGTLPRPEPGAGAVAEALFGLMAGDGGPSVSSYVSRHATEEQTREFLIHKSVYQLKEADPHTWAIPRLRGRAKSAMVEIQTDEYGGGIPGKMHSELFAHTMQGLGLDPEFGAYIDSVPAITLCSVNVMSLFGLHRRHRGAICGHLAAYEITSSIPNAKYARGLRRLGFTSPVTDYFDEHVEADAVHEQIAARDMAGALIEQDPTVASNVFFGAATVRFLDALVGRWQLDAWKAGTSSLRLASKVAA